MTVLKGQIEPSESERLADFIRGREVNVEVVGGELLIYTDLTQSMVFRFGLEETCPVCGGSADDPQPEPPEVTGDGQVGDTCTHPIHDTDQDREGDAA